VVVVVGARGGWCNWWSVQAAASRCELWPVRVVVVVGDEWMAGTIWAQRGSRGFDLWQGLC
jgi:hypothetical protein